MVQVVGCIRRHPNLQLRDQNLFIFFYDRIWIYIRLIAKCWSYPHCSYIFFELYNYLMKHVEKPQIRMRQIDMIADKKLQLVLRKKCWKTSLQLKWPSFKNPIFLISCLEQKPPIWLSLAVLNPHRVQMTAGADLCVELNCQIEDAAALLGVHSESSQSILIPAGFTMNLHFKMYQRFN